MSRTTLTGYSTAILLGFLAASTNVFAWDERQHCVKPPDGMVGWWPGNGNTNDVWAGHNAQLVNGAIFAPGKVEQAFRLNGVSAFVNVPDAPALNFGTGDFTVDLWVKFNTTAGEQVLLEKYIEFPSAGPVRGWTLTKLDGNALRLALDGGINVDTAPLSIQPNTWYHFAARRNGQVVTLFMNGNIVASRSIPGGLNVDSTSSLKFGRRCSPTDTPGCNDTRGFFLNGRVDEVELFNRAVPDSQLRAIYSAGRAGKCEPVSGTVSGIKLDEVTCHGGGGRSVAAVISDSQFWNCTRAGFTVTRRSDNVQVKIKGTVLGE